MQEEEYNKIMQEQTLAGQVSDTATRQMQQQFFLEEKEKGMIKEQLDLGEELDRMEHLLRGHIQKDMNGQRVWVEPTDPDMIILTEYGIQLILNTVAWYINKNTLLSNYDAKTIMIKMRDFASALNKTIFMEYQKVFKQPSFEECKKVLRERIEKKIALREFSLEMAGQEFDKVKIEKEMMHQIEGRIEKEIGKIKESIMKTKLTRYLLLIREVQDAVHSTYNRAYMGMERKTLREHIHVAETRGGIPVQQNKGGLFGWLKG